MYHTLLILKRRLKGRHLSDAIQKELHSLL